MCIDILIIENENFYGHLQRVHDVIGTAIELYKKEEVSLSKAAELAGMTTIEFKDILGKRGFIREIEARPTEEIDKKLRKYL